MRKSTLQMAILGTIGGLVFALGMCMCLVAEWNTFAAGVAAVVVGAILLLAIFPVYRKDHPKSTRKKKPLDKGAVGSVAVGIISMIVLGIGMALTLANNNNIMLGIIIGVVGLIGCILNYPVYQYLMDGR